MTDNARPLDWPPPGEGAVRVRLPRPPGVVRRFWARHPRLVDTLIALTYLLPAIGFTLLIAIAPDDRPPIPFLVAGLAVLIAGAAGLLLRRAHPRVSLAVAVAATLAAAPLLGTADLALIPFALYGLAIYGSAREAWIGFGIAVPLHALAHGFAGPGRSDQQSFIGLMLDGGLPSAVLSLIVVLIAINIGNRRRYVEALVDRARTLERESQQLAQLAALDERSRIAREMHDIVSHSLTVMVTLAEGSAAIAPDDAERAQNAMRRVAETGRSALTDMRRMLGVLTEAETVEGAQLAPQPGLVDLHELVERFRTAGLPVRLASRGTETTDPAEQLAVYRIVQESLTNVLKHAAAPTRVEVDVRFRRSSTTVTVTDDGTPRPETGDGGHGLVGMRERVALYGGTLDSGPVSPRGWQTSATLRHDRSSDA